MDIKTSGKQEQFNAGSVRDNADGKPRIDLIPTSTLIKLGIHYGNGASHYGDRNWEKGQPITRYMASFERHYNYFKQGITDENHLIAAIWNLIAIDYTIDAIKSGLLPKELDDRPTSMKENNPVGNLVKNIIDDNVSSHSKQPEKQERQKEDNKEKENMPFFITLIDGSGKGFNIQDGKPVYLNSEADFIDLHSKNGNIFLEECQRLISCKKKFVFMTEICLDIIEEGEFLFNVVGVLDDKSVFSFETFDEFYNKIHLINKKSDNPYFCIRMEKK